MLLNDIDIFNFADDITAYVSDVNLESVLEKLEENSELSVTYSKKNYLKLSVDKCHMILSFTEYEHVWFQIR